MVWFALNIGSEKNADPRWLLPLICRAGDVSKQEVGSIRVGDGESKFEIRAEHADRFAETIKSGKHNEARIWRVADGIVTQSPSPSPSAPPPPRTTLHAPRAHAPRPHGAREDRRPAASATAPRGSEGGFGARKRFDGPADGRSAKSERGSAGAGKRSQGPSYSKDSYSKPGYSKDGHAKPSYSKDGYSKGSNSKDGYAKAGHAKGFDKGKGTGTRQAHAAPHGDGPKRFKSGGASPFKGAGARPFKGGGKAKRHP